MEQKQEVETYQIKITAGLNCKNVLRDDSNSSPFVHNKQNTPLMRLGTFGNEPHASFTDDIIKRSH